MNMTQQVSQIESNQILTSSFSGLGTTRRSSNYNPEASYSQSQIDCSKRSAFKSGQVMSIS